MKKSEVLHVRITPEKKRTYRTTAEGTGKSLTTFVEEALDVWAGLSVNTHQLIDDLSAAQHIPKCSVLENILTGWFLRRKAYHSVWGTQPGPLLEFASDEHGVITGIGILDTMMFTYVQEELRKRIDRLLDEEATSNLEGADRRFMIAFRQGRTWFESEEYKKAKSKGPVWSEQKNSIAQANRVYRILEQLRRKETEIAASKATGNQTKIGQSLGLEASSDSLSEATKE